MPRPFGSFKKKSKAEGAAAQKKKQLRKYRDRKRCRFCRAKTTYVDYKDIEELQKLCTAQGKIFSRKRSGNCAKHQKVVKNAVKYARFLALLAYTE
ncbi:MAG: 30S ribosomal protein S18 [Planctomycetes bacterium]|nr:30S ribosomal protein S18 [Planctomycetota bacterium]